MYTYGTRLRPPDIGCVPGYGVVDISFDEFKYNGRHYWGKVTYTRHLTEEELEEYEMDFIKEEY